MNLSKHFTEAELRCSHCQSIPKEYGLELAARLEELRTALGVPLVINSGYRCPEHPVEAAKGKGSKHAHTRLFGVDIAVSMEKAYDLVAIAALCGWHGVGVQQKGSVRYIHLDRREGEERRVWSY